MFRLLLLMMVALLGAGCSTDVNMTDGVQKNITTVQPILLITQKEIDVTLRNDQPMAGLGLIPALIHSAIVSSANTTRIDEARGTKIALQSYDFRNVMKTALEKQLPKSKYQFVLPVQVLRSVSESVVKYNIEKSQASAVMFCNVFYALDQSTLNVTAVVEMFPKSQALKSQLRSPKDNPVDINNLIYKKSFVYTQRGVVPSNVENALNAAAVDIAKLVSQDIATVNR